ncbi:ThuA-like domain-containing protein [Echria macrotheca]|uniref:ThuA-like domain-containing protein n=1 Tax=Echria macrotheca TaxID=438768 RepID=A0AAJ0F0H9_9PEZI|nr:ThuA-like domain-containing protein [Echria macrotheca]
MSSTPFQVLVFSRTVAYRHDSIPAGIEAIQGLSKESSSSPTPFTVIATEDPEVFTPSSLARFRVVIFLQSSGEFLDTPEQLDALKGFVRAGGGVVGVHCASFALESSEWYGNLMGAVFKSHPPPSVERIRIVDPGHPIMAGSLPKGGSTNRAGTESLSEEPWQWKWLDEWYIFKQEPADICSKVHVLVAGGLHGHDHPLAWCQEFDGGRSFYTSLGHFDEAYKDFAFLNQLLSGILWTAGKAKIPS